MEIVVLVVVVVEDARKEREVFFSEPNTVL